MINVYTVNVTVKVAADSEREAYGYITHALAHAKKQEIIYVDAEVIETTPEEDDEPCLRDGTPIYPSRQQTRTERLEGLADRGVDTWSDYRGER